MSQVTKPRSNIVVEYILGHRKLTEYFNKTCCDTFRMTFGGIAGIHVQVNFKRGSRQLEQRHR